MLLLTIILAADDNNLDDAGDGVETDVGVVVNVGVAHDHDDNDIDFDVDHLPLSLTWLSVRPGYVVRNANSI